MIRHQQHPLDPCYERLIRAAEHLTEFEVLLDEVRRNEAYEAGIEFDPLPPYCIKKVNLPGQTFFDMRFGVLVGEIFYNLRSSLDYLIYELARHDSGRAQMDTQFPICDCARDFSNQKKRRLKGVSDEHIAAIERLQPFNGCAWTGQFRDHSNADKHRELVPINGKSTITVHSGLEKDLDSCRGYERKVAHPELGKPEVPLKVHVRLAVAFPGGGEISDIVQNLNAEIKSVLDSFRSDFI